MASKKVAPGDVVAGPGQHAQQLVVVASGLLDQRRTVEVWERTRIPVTFGERETLVTQGSTSARVRTLGPGAVYGYGELAGLVKEPSSLIALEPSEVFVMLSVDCKNKVAQLPRLRAHLEQDAQQHVVSDKDLAQRLTQAQRWQGFVDQQAGIVLQQRDFTLAHLGNDWTVPGDTLRRSVGWRKWQFDSTRTRRKLEGRHFAIRDAYEFKELERERLGYADEACGHSHSLEAVLAAADKVYDPFPEQLRRKTTRRRAPRPLSETGELRAALAA